MRRLKSDQVQKILMGILLSLLAFQGKQTLSLLTFQGKQVLTRLDRLEATQTRILFTLGIPPVASHTLDFQVKNASLGRLSQNR